MLRVRSGLFLALLLLSAPASAEEDPTTAAAMFKAANAAYARGEYRAAATAFEEADRRAPRAAAIYNAALAWDDAGDKARAADDYALALSRNDVNAANATRARERLASLEKQLAVVDFIAVDATVSVAHAKRPAPTRVYLVPGSYTVEATWPDGRRKTTKVNAELGPGTVTIEAPALPESPPPPPLPPRRVLEPPSRVQQNIGITFVSVGALAAGGAAFLGFRALSARDDFNASNHTDRDARERAANLRTWTNVAWTITSVLAVTGTVLILTAPRGPSVAVGLGEIRMAWAF